MLSCLSLCNLRQGEADPDQNGPRRGVFYGQEPPFPVQETEPLVDVFEPHVAAALGGVRGDVGRVTASDGETTADAWLLDAEGGVITAVLLRRTDAAGPEGELLSRVLESFRET